jgi:secreted trypsin-like serine protease
MYGNDVLTINSKELPHNFSMQHILLFALVVALPGPTSDAESIVGGFELPFGSQNRYPWMTSLQYKGRHFCGAVLMNPTTVVTAAHCKIPEPLDTLSAVARRFNLNAEKAQEGSLTFSITNIIQHPSYIQGRRFNAFDIAVWKVRLISGDPRTIPSYPNSFSFDDGSRTIPNTFLNIMGWGVTQENGHISEKLRIASVPVSDPLDCKLAYPGVHFTSFCAGFLQGGVDSCQSDSGGPIFSEINGKIVLVGLSSYGTGCGLSRIPGAYVKLSTVTDFIFLLV